MATQLQKDNLNGSLSYKLVDTRIGVLKLVASEKGLVAVLWEKDNPRRVRISHVMNRPLHPVLVRTEKELNEYFEGARQVFSVPLDMRGTPFQKQVWEALLGIPFGETRSYGDLADRLGNRAASRAVGAANGRNPIAIIVPCHRVIGATGKLTGFAGGLAAKAHLLRLEGIRTGDKSSKSGATYENELQYRLILGDCNVPPHRLPPHQKYT
jgi:methylated-DNA-[protein]-cysteine S-methyltransferase